MSSPDRRRDWPVDLHSLSRRLSIAWAVESNWLIFTLDVHHFGQQPCQNTRRHWELSSSADIWMLGSGLCILRLSRPCQRCTVKAIATKYSPQRWSVPLPASSTPPCIYCACLQVNRIALCCHLCVATSGSTHKQLSLLACLLALAREINSQAWPRVARATDVCYMNFRSWSNVIDRNHTTICCQEDILSSSFTYKVISTWHC